MARSKLNDRVREALRQAQSFLPADGNLVGLLENLSQYRGRRVAVIERDLNQGGPSGLWIETSSSDWIVVDTAGLPSRRATAICHEVAHMLLGHEGRTGDSDLKALTSHVSPALAARFLTRHGYEEPEELDAETLATHLMTEHTRRVRKARLDQDPISSRLR